MTADSATVAVASAETESAATKTERIVPFSRISSHQGKAASSVHRIWPPVRSETSATKTSA